MCGQVWDFVMLSFVFSYVMYVVCWGSVCDLCLYRSFLLILSFNAVVFVCLVAVMSGAWGGFV